MSSNSHILVIDDSEVILARIKEALTGAGYHVTTTTQAVGNARHLLTCDLVIIDYHMPGINGGDVIDQLRNVNSKRKCLFYLYTSDLSVASSYSELGFDGAIGDKGNQESLVRQVRAIFRMKQMRSLAPKKNA